MRHPAYRFSGIGRPLDPAWPTNRWIIWLSGVAMVAGAASRGWLSGGSLVAALTLGVQCGLAAFLAWAFTREVAPDAPREAFVPAVLAPILVAHDGGGGSIWVLAVGMMAARLVNRTTGKAVEPGDVILLLGLTGLSFVSNWTFGVLISLALVLDVLLPPPEDQPRRRWLLAPAAVMAATSALRLLETGVAPSWPDAGSGGFALSAILVATLMPRPESIGDVDGRRLDPLRVRLGAALGLAAFALAGADPQAASAYPVIGGCVVLAVALGVLRLRLRKRP